MGMAQTVPFNSSGSELSGHVGLMLPGQQPQAWRQVRAVLPSDLALSSALLRDDDCGAASISVMLESAKDAVCQLANRGAELLVFHGSAVAAGGPEGEEVLLRSMAVLSGRATLSVTQAMTAALRALRARRVVLLSQYTPAAHGCEMEVFRRRGFEVVGGAGYGCRNATELAAVSSSSWRSFVLDHADDRTDAYVLNATSVWTMDVVTLLEDALDRPVLIGAGAVAWWCARHFGVPISAQALGSLFDAA